MKLTVQQFRLLCFCLFASFGQIALAQGLSVSISTHFPICEGYGGGSATATPIGGTPPYQYFWSNGQNGASTYNLQAGALSVTVTDATNAFSSANTNVVLPSALTATVAGLPNACTNLGDPITVTTLGGVPPYTYAWITGETSPVVAFRGTPNYMVVTVTDARGCFKVAGANIPSPMSIDMVENHAPCPLICDGSIEVTLVGGAGPFTFNWDNGNNPTAQVQNWAPAGVYNVTVTDAFGCSRVGNGMLVDPLPFQVNVNITNPCGGSADANVNITGGTPPYNINWNNGNTGTQGTNLPNGNYTLSIVDANGCNFLHLFEIDLDGINLQASSTPAMCSATADGSVSVIADGGQGMLSYAWSNGATTATVNNLAPGTYVVTVTDELGCIVTSTSIVQSTTVINGVLSTNNGSCDGVTPGTIFATASGGAAPYTYTWSNNQTGGTLSGVSPGTYTVTITDANGCSTTKSTQLSSADFNIEVAILRSVCNDSPTGIVQANAIGAGAPFTYVWNNWGLSNTIGGLTTGTYIVTVTDASGCAQTASIEVEDQAVAIDILSANERCAGDNNGAIQVNLASTPQGPVTYTWNTGATTPKIENLTAGTYSVTVSDGSGCDTQESIVVEPGSTIQANFNWSVTDCDPNGLTVQLDDLSNGSNPIVNWLWNLSNGQVLNVSDPVITINNGPLDVTVTVTNGDGCQATAQQTVEASNLTIAINNQVNACQFSPVTLNAQANNPNGVIYNWFPANLIASGQGTATPILTTDTPGDYTVTLQATNAFGCTVNEDVQVHIEDMVAFNPGLVAYRQCDGLTVDIENTNNAPYPIEWFFDYPNNTTSVGGAAPSFTYTQPGTYTVAIVPSVQCGDPVYLDVVVGDAPNIDIEIEATTCQSPAIVTISDQSTVPGGISSWNWNLGNLGTATTSGTQLSLDASQLVNATLTVTYGNGCEATISDELDVHTFEAPTLEDYYLSCEENVNIPLNPNADLAFEYAWTGGSVNGSTQANPIAVVAATTTYQVVITDPNNPDGCQSEQSVEVFIPDPKIDLEPLEDLVLCDDAPIQVIAQANVNATYSWSTVIDQTQVIGTQAGLSVTPTTAPTTYYVVATDQYGCTATEEVTLANYASAISFEASYESCTGVALKLDNMPSAFASITRWNPYNPFEQPINASTQFEYDYTNAAGCDLSGMFDVFVFNFSDYLDINATPDTILQGQETQLQASISAGYMYEWSPSEGLSSTNISNPLANPRDQTRYKVKVTDSVTGCIGEAFIDVVVKETICEEPYVYIPNAFSPNGDGVNDQLYVRGIHLDEVYLAIYNRWGEKVFETDSKEIGWDGSFQGKMVSGDVYGYYLKVKCFNQEEFFRKGNITVIR